ncbi:MAG TPA: type II toxin-antitoxin system VapC family toxin [Gammaproteobacteria bacterium]|nr:type II toxin-antitoxin system VapC family toxin [Gammaproteobacteria bacterium]
MNGIDTNVLVRYIVQDDPDQSRIATHFLEKECSVESPAFISGIVLCELVWVLESAYEYSKQEIVSVLECILKVRQFHLHEPDILLRTLQGYAQGQADFADHYIVQLNHYYDCLTTVTFDKKAAKLSFSELLS